MLVAGMPHFVFDRPKIQVIGGMLYSVWSRFNFIMSIQQMLTSFMGGRDAQQRNNIKITRCRFGWDFDLYWGAISGVDLMGQKKRNGGRVPRRIGV